MSIADELNKNIADLAASYVKTADAGATQPTQKNFDNLPATIAGIDSAVASGIPPLSMNSVSDYPARDYKLYGQSVQDGTPTPDNPVEIASVGDLITEGENVGKYSIPITVSDGTNSETTNIILDEPLRKIGNYTDYIDFKSQSVVRNIASIDLSTLTWSTSPAASTLKITSAIPEIKYTDNNLEVGEALAEKYIVRAARGMSAAGEGYLAVDTTVVSVYSTVNPSGMFIYRMASPTTTSVSLPSLERFAGEVTVTVGTSIQPSNMWVKF